MPAGFTETDVPDQNGKTALVTGANTGIGFHVARVLAENGARVLLGCRSEDRALEAIEEIRETAPEAELAFVELDLGDLSSIRAAADIISEEPFLDLLINNAGIMGVPRELTADGFEPHFGVNHLGPFALTSLLIDKVAETPGARVISTASLAHKWTEVLFDDIGASKQYYRPIRYGMSKLSNLLFAYELQRRLEAAGVDAISVACHPGVAESELARHMPDFVSWVMPLMSQIFNSADQGAWPTLMAATHSDVKGGEYYGPSNWGEAAGPARRVTSNFRSHNKTDAIKLWDLSIEMTGIDPDI